jgi:hypothetical protein
MKITKRSGVLRFPIKSIDDTRIKIGMEAVDVRRVVGIEPFEKTCQSMLGVEICVLKFKKAEFDESRFTASFLEIRTVTGKLLSFSSTTREGKFSSQTTR